MRGLRCSTGSSLAGRTAPSSSGSRTPTPSGPRSSPSRASSRTCGGSGSTGTRAPTWADRIRRTGSRSGSSSIARTRATSSRGDGRTYCFCPAETLEAGRKVALAAGLPPVYGGRCRALAPDDAARRVAEGERAAVRFAVTAGREIEFDDLVRGELTFSTDVIGDPIIIRSDGRPAYNFAVVIDDALMEITHVFAGRTTFRTRPGSC